MFAIVILFAITLGSIFCAYFTGPPATPQPYGMPTLGVTAPPQSGYASGPQPYGQCQASQGISSSNPTTQWPQSQGLLTTAPATQFPHPQSPVQYDPTGEYRTSL